MKGLRRILTGAWTQIIALSVFFLMTLFLVLLTGEIAAVLFYLAFVLLIYLGIMIYFLVVYNSYSKARDRLCAIPGFSKDRFARETARMPKINNMVLCSDAILYNARFYMVKIIPIQDIVWAYLEEDVYFELNIYTKDHEKITVPVMVNRKKGGSVGRFILRLIIRKNKGVFVGYKQEYEALFYGNFPALLAKVQEGGLVDSNQLEQEYVRNNYYVQDLH